jgi:hypothetical protein
MPSHPHIVPRPAGYEELTNQASTLLFFSVSLNHLAWKAFVSYITAGVGCKLKD